ncbi:hypothetical protein GZH47_32755 (plasmid) [Paenibacillus rhizovicinus]|uniref:Uncharacterized protein n=1 Tax=Paenibacillus rhizovicinus TaxID=2704463 RepID=A0A6C0PAR3_9BACL|nr:hypothetical protein [Paenibacillus rhizovicinus]QHW35670.1 hypothetical protein GZH47_32755 [Paenibacillus rhizovicinus]
MATPNYMKRIAFLDGQVLHDFHLNTMQANISEAIKLKTTLERYDMLLLVSPYKYYFCEGFTDDSNRDPSSNAVRSTLSFSINQDSWITPLLELPATTDELYIQSNMEEDPDFGSTVKFFYRHSTSGSWNEVKADKPIYLTTASKFVQLKVQCLYTGTTRPTVYDFCLMWK